MIKLNKNIDQKKTTIASWYSNFGKTIISLLWIPIFSILIVLQGCCKKQPNPKQPLPELRILKRRHFANLAKNSDIKIKINSAIEKNGKKYYVVNKNDLILASKSCRQKKTIIKAQERYINFYEKEIRLLKNYQIKIKRE